MNNKIHGPLKYHGGKTYLAKNLVSLMPFHTHFVEVFCGGLAFTVADHSRSTAKNPVRFARISRASSGVS